MKITDCIGKKEFITIIEFLPPQYPNLDKLEGHVRSIQDYTQFISLTSKPGALNSLYVAGLLELGRGIKTNFIPHITLREFGNSHEMVCSLIMASATAGIDNLFVMSGDSFSTNESVYNYTSELVKFISDMNEGTSPYLKKKVEPTNFCIGVVASQYRDRKTELRVLEAKKEAGAEYAILQMCFDPHAPDEYSYKLFCEELQNYLGCDFPVIAGIPIPDKSTIDFAEGSAESDPIYMPEIVKKRILQSADDKLERIEIAREILDYFRSKTDVPGVDIFSRGSVKLAKEVLKE
ncbi:MAG: methylenetetrahydrofolate reductase [Nanoarchaeota archaeon]